MIRVSCIFSRMLQLLARHEFERAVASERVLAVRFSHAAENPRTDIGLEDDTGFQGQRGGS